jgi:hypothetical protein
VTSFHGIDEAAGAVYVSGTLDGSRERHLYRLPFQPASSARPSGSPRATAGTP